MSERDRAMVDAIASGVVERVIDAAKDPATAGPIFESWAEHIQRLVGRAVLRALFYVLVGLVALGSFKYDWLRRGYDVMTGKG